jgi:hypothetical protein
MTMMMMTTTMTTTTTSTAKSVLVSYSIARVYVLRCLRFISSAFA